MICMTKSTIKTAQKEDIVLLNRLSKLLEEQINVIHHSDISGKQVEILAEQTQAVVVEIEKKGLIGLEQFREQREHIQRLYNNLNLAIIARKNETEKQLTQLRKGKKIIDVYRNNV